MKVLYLFGPSLGALGRRDPQTYGSETLEDIMTSVTERGVELGHEITWRQSDHEGDLVGWLLAASSEGQEAVVINPDRKSTRLNSSHVRLSRMPSSA